MGGQRWPERLVRLLEDFRANKQAERIVDSRYGRYGCAKPQELSVPVLDNARVDGCDR